MFLFLPGDVQTYCCTFIFFKDLARLRSCSFQTRQIINNYASFCHSEVWPKFAWNRLLIMELDLRCCAYCRTLHREKYIFTCSSCNIQYCLYCSSENRCDDCLSVYCDNCDTDLCSECIFFADVTVLYFN